MKKIVQTLKDINLKTLYFNLKYFSLRQALKFPVLISKNVYLKEVSGKIHFECPIKFGLIRIGYGNVGIFDKKMSRTIWDVSGDVTFRGYGTDDSSSADEHAKHRRFMQRIICFFRIIRL